MIINLKAKINKLNIIKHSKFFFTSQYNNMRFLDKVCVVTGGASGIGEATCKQFAKEGAKVVIVDWNKDRGNMISQEINFTYKNQAHFIQADISNENDAKKITRETIEKFGDIDVLVNDAAIFCYKGINELTVDDFISSYKVNVIGYFLVTKYAIESMKKKGGAIVNVSSIAAWVALPKLYAYNTTKAANLQMTRDMALDFGKYNIRVNSICPGFIHTLGAMAIGPEMEKLFKEAESSTILKRIGRPEEMATVITFLASNDASYVTGTHLIADGGYTIV